MTTWSKADTRRVQNAVDLVLLDARTREGSGWHDAKRRARIDAVLVEHGLSMVREKLRMFSGSSTTEGRASHRLCQRLESEPWPEHIALPRLLPIVVEEPPNPVQPVVERPTHEELVEANRLAQRELAPGRVAAEVRRIVHELGEISVRRGGESAPFGETFLTWDEVESRVTWRNWLTPIATGVSLGKLVYWLKATANPWTTWPDRGRAFVLKVWTEALAVRALPEVLDLRGLPETHGLLDSDFIEPLKTALTEYERGIVLLVDDNSWALERCLLP